MIQSVIDMEKGSNNRILAITNVPVPYRVDFFNEVNKRVPITVFYEQTAEEQTHRSSEWFASNTQDFDNVFLKKGHNSVKIKTVISEIKKRQYCSALVMGYTKKSEMISIIWFRWHKKPYFLNVDGGFVKEKELVIKKLLKTYFIKGATGYLSTGIITDRYLEHYGAQRDRIYRVPFSSLRDSDILERPLSIEEKLNLRTKLGLSENRIIITVGQFIYRKGFDLLLKACIGMNTDIGVYIIGGEPTDEFLKYKEDNNLTNVHFVGFMQKDELKHFYCAADLFVLPTREDIWGLVINEAMAFGLPVITTERCIAGVELVDENNGAIVPINDVNALREEMIRIISNDSILKTMANSSLIKIKDYTIEKMASRYVAVMTEERG